MLTQEQLVRRLNQLTLRYNLTWFDIEYDADKAITKINSFLGTKYPKITTHMTGPNATYSMTVTTPLLSLTGALQYDAQNNLITKVDEYEIIKEEYFHSVIIPYIAMEVLSRDEEFTTIYTKYMTEVNDGLYDMFQKEFNSVPFEFRQNPDQGVFFGLDTAQGILQHNERNLNIPTFKFRINYYPHDNSINLEDGEFIKDLKAYVYDESATILYPQKINNVYSYYYSIDGATAYQFLSWSKNFNAVASVFTEVVGVPTIIKMRSDLNLYAIWNKTEVLINSLNGVVTINSIHRPSLVNLTIPEKVNGITVITIPTSFISANAPALDVFKGAIYLPSSVNTISTGAFAGFQGVRIELNEGITSIGASAFASTPNLKEIIIPSTVTTIAAGAFPVVSNKHLVIKVRRLEANRPSGWAGSTVNDVFIPTWYTSPGQNDLYSVEIIWGYNGA